MFGLLRFGLGMLRCVQRCIWALIFRDFIKIRTEFINQVSDVWDRLTEVSLIMRVDLGRSTFFEIHTHLNWGIWRLIQDSSLLQDSCGSNRFNALTPPFPGWTSDSGVLRSRQASGIIPSASCSHQECFSPIVGDWRWPEMVVPGEVEVYWHQIGLRFNFFDRIVISFN